MNAHHVKYLLIGGGIASSSAAQAIREIDPNGSIMLVSQEIVRPYHRPLLSKEFLRREKAREEIFTLGRDWFEAHHVQLRTGRRAAHLDVTRSAVTLDQGEVIGYEQLLLATGVLPAHLNIPGAQLPNLLYFRSLEDTEHLQKAIDKATSEGHPHDSANRHGPRGRAVVIGAGVLGVELAASLSQMGIAVDLLCGRDHPWDKFAGEITGKALTSFLSSRGVRVHGNARPIRLEGDGRVQRVVVDAGRFIECDFAVAAVGAIAQRELLRGTPIDAEKAILTDTHCRTNVPNIYAAGDCAALFDPLFGKHRIVEHWENAKVTGALAGRNMAGHSEEYIAVSHFTSRIFDTALDCWGEGRQVNHRIVRNIASGNGATPQVVEIGVAADGRVAQVLSLGHHGDDEVLRGLVARRAVIDGTQETLKDPSIPFRDLI